MDISKKRNLITLIFSIVTSILAFLHPELFNSARETIGLNPVQTINEVKK